VKRVVLWGPVALTMVLIFGLSSIPDLSTPGEISDKTAHSLAYGVLSLLMFRALAGGQLKGLTITTAVAAVLLTTMYGLSDELHQMFVPGRTADLADVGADAVGAIYGVGAGLLLRVFFWVGRRIGGGGGSGGYQHGGTETRR
jgi:VanZ family protein